MKIKFIKFIVLLLSISTLNAQSYTENHVLKSDNLSESRAISVSLPFEYNLSDKSYPVLYVLDGEYIFSYAKGVVDFLTNDFGYLPEMIVVSISNTNRNRDLYVTLEKDGPYINFLNFLEHELFIFINENYRVNNFRIMYGWSSGSGICNYLLTIRPQLIDGYILSGSGIGPKTEEFIKSNISTTFYPDKFLYANAEDQEPRKSGLLRYQNLIDSLNPKGLATKFEILEQSGHVDVMAKGLDEGLRFIFSNFYIPDNLTLKGHKAIINYYNEISDLYGFNIEIPIGAINESVGILIQNKKNDDAIQLLNYGISIYPYSPTLYGVLGEIHQSASDLKLAKKYFEIAKEKSVDDPNNYLKYEALLNEINQQE